MRTKRSRRLRLAPLGSGSERGDEEADGFFSTQRFPAGTAELRLAPRGSSSVRGDGEAERLPISQSLPVGLLDLGTS